MSDYKKPASVLGDIVGGTAIGRDPTTDLYFRIKVYAARHRFFSPAQEVTGDGDNSPVFENSGFLYGEVWLHGWALGAYIIGIENLVSSANPIAMTYDLGGHANDLLTYTAVVQSIDIASRSGKSAPNFVGLTEHLLMTSTLATSIEETE